MRLLVIADRPPKQKIRDTVSRYSVDLICTLGDLDYFSLLEIKDIADIPAIGVYGNHCSGRYFEELGMRNMHLSIFEYQGITFGGFEGSVRYKCDPMAKMYTQDEATALLQDFPHVDVMLAHCPPYGINDEPEELAHQGFSALRTYIEEQKPAYFFHGHTYPTADTVVKEFQSTKIVYVYQDQVVDINI